MTSAEFVDLLTQLGVMLFAAVVLGAVLRKLKQPSVVGEMAAGVLIGVTVLGSLAPGVYDSIFASTELVTSTRGDIIKVGMLLFLFVAGSEVDLSDVKTLGRRSLIIGVIGTLVPIALGIAFVYATPMSMWGESMGIDRLPFAAFIGMNLANSANPVLARILIDLGLMKSPIATVMMTATVVDDLINWTLYAVILGSITTGGAGGGDSLGMDLLMVAVLFVTVLVGVRWLAPHLVAVARRYLAWPNGYVAVVGLAVFAVAAFSDHIGVGAFLGAFLVGVAFSGVASGVGATGHKSLTHVTIGIFAPLFFVSMALGTDFIAEFDPVLVVGVIAVALGSKLLAVLLGVKAAGLPLGREAWAIAWGLNARGATGIIFAATGLQAGIIDEQVFVALVVMAIVTSILAGPMMVRSLGPLRKELTVEEDEFAEEGAGSPAIDYAARMADRDLTEAERADLEASPYYRVVVAIDDPASAGPLVEVAAELAASQRPAEVVLASFQQQSELEDKVMFRVLDDITDELAALRDLEAVVQAAGVAAVSVSQRSTDLAADIAARAEDLGAHALVVGDRRDDPEWVATVDGLVAASPVDIFVVVAPRPRPGEPPRTGPVVVEAGGGLPAEASLEAGVRFALSGTTGLVVVGLDPKAKAARPYRAALDRLTELGRSARMEPAVLDSPEGDLLATDAPFVIRPFSAPEGLEPIERNRPAAERFECPVVLVANDPHRAARDSLPALLDHAEVAIRDPSG